MCDDAWYFDAEKMSFTKKVVSYCPIRYYFKDNGVSLKERPTQICFLNFENLSKKEIKKSDKRLIYYATVSYEQPIFNIEEYINYDVKESVLYYGHYENDRAPFLNSYNTMFLAKSLFFKAIDGKITVYEPNSSKIMSGIDVKDRMGGENDTIAMEDPNTGMLVEKVVEGSISLDEIKSYIFKEDWYLDPITLRLVKKVRSIIPVRYYYRNDEVEEDVTKKMIFEYKFTE